MSQKLRLLRNSSQGSSKFFARIVFGLTCLAVLMEFGIAEDRPNFIPTMRLTNPEANDQDDMCVWVHAKNPEQSTVIASDKSANRIFVYDLNGQVLQSVEIPKPGNIDIRQGVDLGGAAADIVVVNQRKDGYKLVVFRVDHETRNLERCDNDCATGPNYGGCLFHSARTRRLYFFCTSESGAVEQHELQGNGNRGVNSRCVRTLSLGKCEAAVADDETGEVYIAEEKKGVWKFPAEPNMPVSGKLVAAVGEDGLKGDVEGLALFKTAGGGGVLLVSDQGRNRFAVYQREVPHHLVGEFTVEDAKGTDGIEVCSANLGPKYPFGIFACHTDQRPRWVLLTPWADIAATFKIESDSKSLRSPNRKATE